MQFDFERKTKAATQLSPFYMKRKQSWTVAGLHMRPNQYDLVTLHLPRTRYGLAMPPTYTLTVLQIA